MSSSSTTFLLSAADVSWGRRERFCIDFAGLTAAGLDGDHFLADALSANFGTNVEYYFWFDVDGGSVDPAPAGKTAIEIDIATGDAPSVIASKFQAVVEAHANFRAKVDPDNDSNVIVDGEFKGKVTNRAVDVDTTAAIVQVTEGLGGDLGKTSGGVEVSLETNTVDIQSDQTGQIILDSVLVGNSVSATMSFLEMTAARWESIVGTVAGDVFTPGSGTQVVGFGESRVYQSLFDLGGELVLHPTRLAASDLSKDITFFKSAPLPQSINFSGEEAQVMEVEFRALANRDLQSAINIMAFGDSSQDLRA